MSRFTFLHVFYYYFKMFTSVSRYVIAERPREARVTSIRKLQSGIFEPHFWGVRGNVDASCVRRWKKRDRLPIGDN